MIIYYDTRQKKGKHDKKHQQIISMGYELQPMALKIGDYMIEGNNSVSVDTKQNLGEVYSNIVNDKSRFMKEVRRAFENKVKLYVLIEHGGTIKTLNDVCDWKPKYGYLSGRDVMERLIAIHRAYGTDFLFCDKRVTGKRIVELLTEYERNEE